MGNGLSPNYKPGPVDQIYSCPKGDLQIWQILVLVPQHETQDGVSSKLLAWSG